MTTDSKLSTADSKRPTTDDRPPAQDVSRVVIERVRPEIDGGRFPIKRVAGESVVVEANVFADGHDVLRCVVLHRPSRESKWAESEMAPLGNDRWRGEFRRCIVLLE